MDQSLMTFVDKASDILEQVSSVDPDQVGLNGLIAILTKMGEGVLAASAIALKEGNEFQMARLTGQAEVLTAVLFILQRQADAIDAAELAPDLVDELEQVLGDAV
jgi:hypothetical protein